MEISKKTTVEGDSGGDRLTPVRGTGPHGYEFAPSSRVRAIVSPKTTVKGDAGGEKEPKGGGGTVSLEDELECPMCHDFLWHPKTTWCQHSACAACIDSNIRALRGLCDDGILHSFLMSYECPVCRSKVVVPPKYNTTLQNLIESVVPSDKIRKRTEELERDSLARELREEVVSELCDAAWSSDVGDFLRNATSDYATTQVQPENWQCDMVRDPDRSYFAGNAFPGVRPINRANVARPDRMEIDGTFPRFSEPILHRGTVPVKGRPKYSLTKARWEDALNICCLLFILVLWFVCEVEKWFEPSFSFPFAFFCTFFLRESFVWWWWWRQWYRMQIDDL